MSCDSRYATRLNLFIPPGTTQYACPPPPHPKSPTPLCPTKCVKLKRSAIPKIRTPSETLALCACEACYFIWCLNRTNAIPVPSRTPWSSPIQSRPWHISPISVRWSSIFGQTGFQCPFISPKLSQSTGAHVLMFFLDHLGHQGLTVTPPVGLHFFTVRPTAGMTVLLECSRWSRRARSLRPGHVIWVDLRRNKQLQQGFVRFELRRCAESSENPFDLGSLSMAYTCHFADK
jgi:hypothetical protein